MVTVPDVAGMLTVVLNLLSTGSQTGGVVVNDVVTLPDVMPIVKLFSE